MAHSSTRFLLAGAATLGFLGVASSASAIIAVTPPNASDYQIVESCQTPGCAGTFTVINNSSGASAYYVYGFSVGNAVTFSDATTQTHWTASITPAFAFSGITENAFAYINPTSPLNSDLVNDIGPGQSSNRFTFSTLALSSPITINLVNSAGTIMTVTGTSAGIPEPASLALLGAGLLGLFGVARRGRTRV